MIYQHLLASSTTASQVGSDVGTVVGYGIIIFFFYLVYRLTSGLLGKTKVGNTNVLGIFRKKNRRHN